MKIQVCSDLHLEFASNKDWLKHHPILPKGDILVIAGDTYYLEKNYAELDFIKKVADDFKSVYLIPGNHEYYGGFDSSTAQHPMQLQILENVFMVNNKKIEVEGVDLIFSTMWSKIDRNMLDIMRGMADFRKIKFGNEKFTVDHFNEIHQSSFQFITDSVQSNNKKVVITHHLPSSLCNAEEFKGSILNDAFCVEKTNFILDHNINYWIYGHSHRNIGDFTIGNTKIITNQLGYVQWNEHTQFDYEKIIEI